MSCARVPVSARRRASYSTRSHRIVPNPSSPIPAHPQSPIPNPCPCLYACLYLPPDCRATLSGDCRATLSGSPESEGEPKRLALHTIAEQFSPRYESHGDDLVSIDVSGLERLLGPAQTIGEELRREA